MNRMQSFKVVRLGATVPALALAVGVALGFGWGCGFGTDPFADGLGGSGEGGNGPGGESEGPGDTGNDDDPVMTSAAEGSGSDDEGPATDDGMDSGDSGNAGPECAPTPTRMVVLGDSIFACFGVGGKADPRCSAWQVNQYVGDTVGPVSYENLAVNGARTVDVINNQIPSMEVGMPGHVLVLIFIGGNDLAAHIFSSDEAATDAWENSVGPQVAQHWEDIFAFLGDSGNFPDGVTVLMNTQYNPFDDCTASPYPTVTPAKNEIVNAHNAALTARAGARDWAFIADQHGPFLGHGHHFDKPECPNYIDGADNWMNDLIHPDATGHGNLSVVLQSQVDQMYLDCE